MGYIYPYSPLSGPQVSNNSHRRYNHSLNFSRLFVFLTFGLKYFGSEMQSWLAFLSTFRIFAEKENFDENKTGGDIYL